MGMKKQLMILAVMSLSISTIAQETNEFGPQKEKSKPTISREQIEKKRAVHRQRRLQLMERELKKIGVTEEEKAQILLLQEGHRKKMEVNAQQIEKARKNLSMLLDDGAPMEELEGAIQNVSTAQTEQLRILVENRIEMERILGREKHALFMQNARKQFEKHGRRGGPALPPRPGLPPIPGQDRQDSGPPVPPATPENAPSPENQP